MNNKIKDLSARQFGRLRVAPIYRKVKPYTYWYCHCDCGTVTLVRGTSLTDKHTTSCGCFQKESARQKATIHGWDGNPIYIKWMSMHKRCSLDGPKRKSYGLRGIRVCERWRNFKHFLEDMGPTWFEGASLERKNVNGHYDPKNCEWIPLAQQAKNKTTSVFIDTPWGRMNITAAAKKIGINYSTLLHRIINWPREKWFEPNIRIHRNLHDNHTHDSDSSRNSESAT